MFIYGDGGGGHDHSGYADHDNHDNGKKMTMMRRL
jgi:hypothetical protein